MSKEENEVISLYDETLQDFINLAINRFSWEGDLPIGLTSERIEYMLIKHGELFAFKMPMGSLTILPCYGADELNLYGEFDNYIVFAENGKYEDTISIEKGVRIKNNPIAKGNLSKLEKYALRISNIDCTQDVNLFQQNIPKIILTDENGKLTAKALISQLQKFKVAIFGKKSLPSMVNTSDVLDTSAPFLLDKLQDFKNNLYNEVLTYLGVNNLNSDKKERLVVDEVNANNDFVSINLDLMYDLRKRACEDINKMFGVNITVKKREVQESGNSHNDTGGNKEE